MAEGSWIAWKLYHPTILSTLTFTVRESAVCHRTQWSERKRRWPIRIVVS